MVEVDLQHKEQECREYVEKMRIKTFDDDVRVIVGALLKIVSNILLNPDDPKVRTLRMQNKVVQKIVGLYSHALEILAILGFRRVESAEKGELIVLDPKMENFDLIEVGFNVLADLAREVGIPEYEIPKLDMDAKTRAETAKAKRAAERKEKKAKGEAGADAGAGFDVFSPHVTRLEPQPRSENEISKTEQELAELKAKREAIIAAAGIPERELVVYDASAKFNPKRFSMAIANTGGGGGGSGSSKGDLALVAHANQSRQESNKKKSTFRTKAMRELDELKQARIYTKTCIRVQFPDRVVIQANFAPSETVSDVIDLIKDCMVDSLTPVYLYTTPPLEKLELGETLENCHLVPAALIHLGWTEEPPSGEYLKESLLKDAITDNSSPKNNAATKEYPAGVELVDEKEKAKQAAMAKKKNFKPKWFKT